MVNTEIGNSDLQCTSTMAEEGKSVNDLCVPSHCSVEDDGTDCVRDNLPKEYTLKETVCEKCREGRAKVTKKNLTLES